MLNKFFGTIVATVVGGGIVYLGYNTFNGDPVSAISRNASMFSAGQDWLIGSLGTSGAGLVVMGLGGLLTILILHSSDDDEEEV